MQSKKIDLTPYFDAYELQNGKPMPSEARRFLTEFAKQAAMFRSWGRWDARSSFDPLSYDQTLSHVERHLAGPRTMYNGTLLAFSEHLARALTDFYYLGYESESAENSEELTQTM